MWTVIEIDQDLEVYLKKNLDSILEANPQGLVVKNTSSQQSVWVLEYLGQRAEQVIKVKNGRRYVIYGIKKKRTRSKD